MKITRYNRGFSLRVSDHEMATLRAAWKHLDWDAFKADLSPQQHRSMAWRMCRGHFLRTDVDRRSGYFRGEKYLGPHNDM